MSEPLLLRCTASTCYTPHGPWAWGHRDAAARVHWLARRRRRLAFCIGRTKRRTGRRTMRAIGLVLLSIAIMALLLTDADAKRRSSAQGSQAAGASGSWCATYPSQGLNDNCSYSSFNQCYYQTSWAAAAFADPIRFRARHTGPATPGQVRSARAAAGSPPVMLHRSVCDTVSMDFCARAAWALA